MNVELRLGAWDCKVYCDKHKRTGKKYVKVLKQGSGNGEVV